MENLKPHERRRQRTHQAILDATRKLLVEKGVNGVSLRAIAREIDYSPAGLYEYFDSREDIIQAVCKEGMNRLAHTMGSVDKDQAYPMFMLGIGTAYLHFARSNPDYFMLIFTTAPYGNQLNEFMVEGSAFPILIDAIQRGIDENYFEMHPGGIQAMAMVFWSSVHGLAMLEQTQLKGADLDFEQMGFVVCNNTFQGFMKAS
ncbi:MAG: AcrR family transcriptional regulator [Cellvibrionaceae bacterium]|jgi:AcrR family transcriptional regulator